MSHNGPERRRLRRAVTAWSAFIYVAIILLVGLSVWRIQERSSSDLEIISVQTCHSVNRGREATNEQGRLLKDVLQVAAKRSISSARAASSKRERSEAIATAASYRTLANTYDEIDLADCRYPPIRRTN